ncbi:MAG TPA: hypothetical protein VJP81_11290 [Candidatus Dormibacteraeota bacterium]|nr:hypothetical protein [Candidatus Dormibacteraeota bacterium]
MPARNMVLGVLAAGGLVLGLAGSASANVVWCYEDPPTQIVTPSGSNLLVNTSVSVVQPEVKYLRGVFTTAATAPDGKGGTLVTVRVSVPATVSTARITSSVNRYQVTTTALAGGGTTVTLYLDVPAA